MKLAEVKVGQVFRTRALSGEAEFIKIAGRQNVLSTASWTPGTMNESTEVALIGNLTVVTTGNDSKA